MCVIDAPSSSWSSCQLRGHPLDARSLAARCSRSARPWSCSCTRRPPAVATSCRGRRACWPSRWPRATARARRSPVFRRASHHRFGEGGGAGDGGAGRGADRAGNDLPARRPAGGPARRPPRHGADRQRCLTWHPGLLRSGPCPRGRPASAGLSVTRDGPACLRPSRAAAISPPRSRWRRCSPTPGSAVTASSRRHGRSAWCSKGGLGHDRGLHERTPGRGTVRIPRQGPTWKARPTRQQEIPRAGKT